LNASVPAARAPSQARGARLALWLLIALALGALQTLAYFRTALWPLQLLCAAVLAHLVWRSAPVRAAALGWAYGVGWLGAGVWWLFISMHRYGHLPALLAAVAVLALAAALSLYLAAAMAIVARWRSGRWWHDSALFAAAWLLAELARTWLFTGFPWLASGYAHVDAPLAILAPWLGVLGIGAVTAGLAALLSHALRAPQASALALALLAAAAWIGPTSHSRAGATLNVSLLQSNVPQDEKFVLEQLPATLAWLSDTLRAARGQLVVAPETAIPLLPSQLNEVAPGYLQTLIEHFDQPGRAALIGVPLGDYDRGYSNSVIGLTQGAGRSTPYRYDKQHLVPFGEFIPLGFRWFTDLMNIPLGDFMRGARKPPSFAFAGERWAPNICYEDLYGDELALRFADAATAPTAFVNLSNIAWFGDTIALDQHLHISRMRALEFQRPMLRATNTGATAVIDHEGRVVARLAPFTRGVLETTVQGRSGITPYAWWAARLGLWPYLALALVVVAACAWRSPLSAALGRTGPP
jgi:apolipoprotein N-acyltransferase